MATAATDPDPKRRKKEEEEEEEDQQQHHLLDQRETNQVNEKEANDLLSLQFPDWLNLLPEISGSILSLISPSIPDLLSFSAVCKPWRSIAKSSPNPISPPPLLLSSSSSPSSEEDQYHTSRSSMCQLKALSLSIDPRTFRSPISKGALNRNCCGCSFGHLIFAYSSNSNVLIADLFSPVEYRLPRPPRGYTEFTHGVLTAPPSSSSSMLFLICSSPHILCWRFGADPKEWLVINLSSDMIVETVALFKGALLVLHFNGEVFALEFEDSLVNWKRLPVVPRAKGLPDNSPGDIPSLIRLAECDGELLLVCFMRTRCPWMKTIEVYRVDFGEGVWVRVQSIGDWCLFMDYVGNCPIACRNPRKWGGQSNCIYFAGPWVGNWSLLPMDGNGFEHLFNKWPSPVWVYPSTLL